MIVDTSVWVEILSDGPLKNKCEKEIGGKKVYIPTVVVYELYKKFRKISEKSETLEVMAYLQEHTIMELDRFVAMLAAELSILYNLPMADSLVLAHARNEKMKLLTLDNDFINIPDAIILK